MIAISVKQPWAYLLCTGAKNIENRTWKLPEKYKGKRVLIHASGKTDKEPYMLFNDAQIEAIENSITDIMDVFACYHNTSAIIGSVVFTDCVVNHKSGWAEKTRFVVELEKGLYLASGQGDPSRTLSLENACLFCDVDEAENSISKARKYRPFKNAKVIANEPIYNWVASDPILFDTPIPSKGKLSFWDFPDIYLGKDEQDKEICGCTLGIPEELQVIPYGNGEFHCRYCGGKWYK